MARTPRIPILWPAAWRDVKALDLLNGSAVTCLLFDSNAPPALRQAAVAKGFNCPDVRWTAWGETDWSKGRFFPISGGVWPGAAASRNRQEGGPTGAPWVDANGWIVQLARARAAKGSELWVNSDPPEETRTVNLPQYLLSLSETWAYGARRPVWLAPHHAAGAIAGTGEGAAVWKAVNSLLRWQLARDAWMAYQPVASLLVVSDFSGPNEYMAGEVLNLSARQGIAFTPVETGRLHAASFTGKRAALYVDQTPAPQAAAAHLRMFAESGGLVLSLKSTAALFGSLKPSPATHPRFDLFQLGKGRLAVASQDFDDPWILARDAHLLMSRRWDSIRLFNAGSLLAYHVAAPDGGSSLVHVLNYTGRPSANQVALQIPSTTKSARMHNAGQPQSAPAAVHRRDGRTEVDIPPFPVHCVLELAHA
jgi:hypothetical protein